ncbi:MAG TPA: hypothetical protein PLG73_14535 [Candidatus Sumerlaeota bacterium]|nr:hypothetical protein [Candidatus Sumerlaeota bacterium]
MKKCEAAVWGLAVWFSLVGIAVSAADFSLVGDINPGVDGSNPRALYVFNGNLYFRAHTPESGLELWKVDSTTKSPILIKDINPGLSDGLEYTEPHSSLCPNTQPYYAALGGNLYFAADDGLHGLELWRTDGTTSGTALVRDIKNGPLSSNPISLSATSRLFFRADSSVWSYRDDTDDLQCTVIVFT